MSKISKRWSCAGLGASCLLFGCGSTGAPAQDYGTLLKNVSEDVILPEHRDFASHADALVVAVQALEDRPSDKSLKSAQEAWRATRRAYRVLDSLHFGPGYTLHISERIDVAPVNTKGIEALVAGTDALDDQAVGDAGGQKKGFLGLEYLLFADPSTDKALAPALADDDGAVRRRTLALSIADEIRCSAHELDDAWEPATRNSNEVGCSAHEPGDAQDSNYAEQLEQAGSGSMRYATQRAAVDDVVSGGVGPALELIVGVRLALPLGYKSGGTPEPESDPTRRSDSAVADMQGTLSGVTALYQGHGISAVIHGLNPQLDQTVNDQIAKLQSALNGVPAPFDDAVLHDTDQVKAAYTAGKALKSTWNTDVSSALGATVQADFDGD